MGQKETYAARRLLEKTFEIQQVVLGPQHKDTLRSLFLTGHIYYEEEQYDNAMIFFKQTVDAWKATLGLDHATTRDALQSVGYCLYKLRKHDEAQDVLQQAVKASLSGMDVFRTSPYISS